MARANQADDTAHGGPHGIVGDLGTALREILPLAAGKLPQALLDAAAEDLPLLSATPAVAVHGDFWGHNVLVDRGRISVVDWEAFHYGAPLEDFFTFALGTVFRQLLGVERGAELIRNVFLGSSPCRHGSGRGRSASTRGGGSRRTSSARCS